MDEPSNPDIWNAPDTIRRKWGCGDGLSKQLLAMQGEAEYGSPTPT